MNKITDQQFKEIEELINSKQWANAEKYLLKLCKTNDSRIYFILGHLYDDWDNPRRDEENARKYFSLATESSNPIEYAFVRLSRIEGNKNHSVRILKKGLQFFPESEEIYYQLFIYVEPSAREKVFEEIRDKECLSERIIIRMALTHYDLKEFKKVINVLSGIDVKEAWNRNILKCIVGFSYYEEGKITEATEIFRKLIDEDINHKLNYVPHFGLINILLEIDNWTAPLRLDRLG